MSKLEDLRKLVNEGMDVVENDGTKAFYNMDKDYEKCFDKKNKAAGVRLRKILQQIKVVAQEIRNESK